MSRIRIVRRRRPQPPNRDPTYVPSWFTDIENLSPCPCGEEPDSTVVVVNGSANLQRWVHYRCLDWLEHEMDEDELAAKREWERRHSLEEDEDE